MSDYTSDLQKYSKTVDEAAIAGIVKHLGIALRSRDASLVSCSDPVELERVRESFLKRKLKLTLDDAELDQAIQGICEQMKGTSNKSRVTFYYLLAKQFDQLSLFNI